MTRKPAQTPTTTPDFGPTGPTTPGLEDVLKYLEGLRSTGTTDLFVVDDELEDDEPITQKPSETRNPPRDLLDALLMLRLHSMRANAGLTSFRPPRGCLQVIVAPIENDRTDIRTVLPQMIGRDPALPDPAIRVDDDVTRKRTGTGVLGSIRSDILQGNPVIAAMASDDMIPDDLRVAMQPSLRLPPLSRRMLEAVMAFHFDQTSVELQQPDARIAQLSDVALSSIFAAEGPEAAIERLDRAASQKTHTRVTLDDVHGQPGAVGALRQAVEDLRSYQSGAVNWSEVTKSFLLLGPPGTGKSLMAQGLAGSAGINFVKTSYSDCQRHGHQGDMLKALNAAVETAIATAPSVFFIDEVDSFHNRQGRTGSKDGYILGVVNGLLTQLDRLSATRGVILLAATNYPDRVDPAVIRPGRFDRHIHVGRPDRSGIRSMLEDPLSGLTFEPAEIDRLCDQLLGSSGAEIAAMIRDARTRARAERMPFSFGHLRAAAGAIRPPVDPGLIWRIAVHEAGHLLAGHLLQLPSASRAIVTGNDGRVIRPYPTCRLPGTVSGMIVHHLAGRIAESLVFDVISHGAGSGPESDLAFATRTAIAAETSYGFGTSLGWIDPETPLYLLPRDIQSRVEARLSEAEARARRLLAERRPDIERIALNLMEKRDLDAAAISALLSDIPRGPDHTQYEGCETSPVDPSFLKETPDAHPF
ncbi:AAA family ATPase [Roseinatronobacter bogoriensis]|nr:MULTISPECIES: AAA family ATPase [Rhodobaca]MBB4208891.1 ATP-dependent Zn protease [Rhodobaca bogoriensis DSM 18756]TDW37843.1 ATP-dependent Zn protease [Rhodobaca barguzinensis]TDY69989.1 ATP-dependent Zn protease [Rhodobaca bogoriensis DSM 18756]